MSDHKLNWTKHNEALRGKALRSLAAMKPLLRSSLSFKEKLLLFKYYIRSLMIDATPVWAFISKSKLERLQPVYNRMLRTVGVYYPELFKFPAVPETYQF